MTLLTIAIFDSCPGGASRLAKDLRPLLTESGIDAKVTAFNAFAPNLDLSDVKAIFLRGLASADSASVPLQAADDSLRCALSGGGTAYQVIYGSNEESLARLMCAIENLDTARLAATLQSEPKPKGTESTAPWAWLCDKCSDSQCEHRLLTDLIERRQTRI